MSTRAEASPKSLVAAVLAMRRQGLSLFDLSFAERFGKSLPGLLKEMGLA